MTIQVGDTFGRLVVTAIAADRIRIEGGRDRRYPMAQVECVCGSQRVVYQSNLRRGLSTSCGCLKIERARDARRAMRKSAPGYGAVHLRLARDLGPASRYGCPCGKRAKDWAYDHLDPEEMVEDYVRPSGEIGQLTYSTKPDHYMPMCHKCHLAFDADHRKRSNGTAA